ncbi:MULTISPECIES: hypothetical protein [Acinetobacter]|uniref:DUF4760 domain-containing protein n=1 Tax=Acinetobacter piscicola TaxID=2006115 RepID=A0A7S7AHI6_9GAMM|nr:MULTISPECIES: hypothetical protein [Acinetobacter]QOW46162.1 hypothetical protein G0028_09785 [Acinetobacter piscicola]
MINKLGWLCFTIIFVLILIYIFAIYFVNLDSNQISTLTNLFVAFSTFTAACTAVLLYNNWKDQARYELDKEIINQTWENFCDLKINLVSLKENVDEINKNSSNISADLYRLFDITNNKITKYYYSQQKLEIFFEIAQDDIIFSEMEEIMQSYMKLLVINSGFSIPNFNTQDALLIQKLNNIQLEFFKQLKKLMLSKKAP